jgi:hypothetical protein
MTRNTMYDREYDRIFVIKTPCGVDVIDTCPEEWSEEQVREFQEYVCRKNEELRQMQEEGLRE